MMDYELTLRARRFDELPEELTEADMPEVTKEVFIVDDIDSEQDEDEDFDLDLFMEQTRALGVWNI